MSLRKILQDLVNVVGDEAERNPDFSNRLETVLRPLATAPHARPTPTRATSKTRRPANRRQPAVLDPIELAARGEDVLRKALGPLTLDQLKDIVADYGMDQDRLAMKWKTSNRVIERIVDTSIRRAHKGEAFRS